jgi:hypothetical protein
MGINGKVRYWLVSRLSACPEGMWFLQQTLQKNLRVKTSAIEAAINNQAFFFRL